MFPLFWIHIYSIQRVCVFHLPSSFIKCCERDEVDYGD